MKPAKLDNLEQARAFYNMAHINKAQGNEAEAEKLLLRVVLTRSRILGSKHPDTLLSLKDLGDTYAQQDQWEAAETIYEKAFSLSEDALGEEHTITTTILAHMAALYEIWAGLATKEEAKQQPILANRDALRQKINIIVNSEENPEKLERAQVLQQLAAVYMTQKAWEPAEVAFRCVLSIYEKMLGDTHQDTFQCLEQMLLLYAQQKKYKDIDLIAKEIIARREKQGAEADPEQKAIGLLSLAGVYIAQQKFDKAEQLIQRVLFQCELRPEQSITTLPAALNALAYVYVGQKKYAQAGSVLQKALLIMEEDLGPEHPEVQRAKNEYQEILKLEAQDVPSRNTRR